MQILVDENIPLISVDYLRQQGHNIIDIRGTDNEGINDDDLWKLAQEYSALLITTDKGFAQLRDKSHSGILIIRLKQPNLKKIHQRLINAINDLPPDDWSNTLVVVRDEVKSIWNRN